MKPFPISWIGLCLIAAMMVAGCSGQKGTEAPIGADTKMPRVSNDPVTLSLSMSNINLDKTTSDLLVEYVRKKHPNITLEMMPNAKGTNLEDLVVAGETPDLIFTYGGNINALRLLNLLYDLTPLIKSYGIDMNRFDPEYVANVKMSSEKGELYGMPFLTSFHALYYNKDIFDKFGIPYPPDGMTWQDTIEVARKVTRTESGIQYRGLESQNNIWVSQAFSLSPVDPRTDRASMNNEQWKQIFELLKSIYTIPGNDKISKGPRAQFMDDKTLAMLLDLNNLVALQSDKYKDLNWDVRQYPGIKEEPNTYGNISTRVLMISPTSKYKDQAMQVIEVAISDEFQTAMSRQTTMSVLKSDAVRQAFGADLPALKNKSLQSIFKSKPAPGTLSSIYRTKAEAIATAKMNDYIQGAADVNTVLRQADEEINKMIETERIK